MASPRFIEIDRKRYLCSYLVASRREQIRALATPSPGSANPPCSNCRRIAAPQANEPPRVRHQELILCRIWATLDKVRAKHRDMVLLHGAGPGTTKGPPSGLFHVSGPAVSGSHKAHEEREV
jgi:hypothetical protein